jgi:hypothetical protein
MNPEDTNYAAPPLAQAPAAIDLSALIPLETAVLEILKPGGIESTGWKITFAGPAHPKTVAWQNEQSRKSLRKAQQIEQAQVNGRKFKAEDKDPQEQQRETVSWIVARIVDWTPIKLGAGEPMRFSDAVAIDLLVKPELGWAFSQMVDFITDDRSFTQRSATN